MWSPIWSNLASLWSAYRHGQRSANQWYADVTWLRLRYQSAHDIGHCLRLLSRPSACGRVALVYQPGQADLTVATLYLGLPTAYAPLLERMAGDFHLSLDPPEPAFAPPAVTRLVAIRADEDWLSRPVTAQIVAEQLFVSPPETTQVGSYWPQPLATPAATWSLPEPPPLGVTRQPQWPVALLSEGIESGENGRCWPVGWSAQGQPIQLDGRLNLYGQPAATSQWLTTALTQLISADPTRLVVLDGRGDLLPQLKRQGGVTRRLGTDLTYLDLDQAGVGQGLNPLTAVAGESPHDQLRRWQQWGRGLGLGAASLDLLATMQAAGATTIPDWQQWLRQAERAGLPAGGQDLQQALNRFCRPRLVREWVSWPTNPLAQWPETGLLFACRAASSPATPAAWSRRQLLRAVLLAALSLDKVRLVVHGWPWAELTPEPLAWPQESLISNGPLLDEGSVLLTASRANGAHTLAQTFLATEGVGGAVWAENLSLLRPGEALLLHGQQRLLCQWQRPGATANSPTVTEVVTKRGQIR